jgi:hypothetical protein
VKINETYKTQLGTQHFYPTSQHFSIQMQHSAIHFTLDAVRRPPACAKHPTTRTCIRTSALLSPHEPSAFTKSV